MNIAVLSGKGGTGKTTVSTNLSLILGSNYIDCDVEEPNGFIFLQPYNINKVEVEVDIPVIDEKKCNICGDCVKACNFNALGKSKSRIMVFHKLCHSCGACSIACSTGALQYDKKTVGVIEEGMKGNIVCKRGILNIGEPIAVPVLRKLLKELPSGINLLDSPPGTSCNVVTTLQYADRAILVTEPTVFGLHDLEMAVKLVKTLKIPFGLIVNKYDEGNTLLEKYIDKENIDVLGYIPYKKVAAQTYSKGNMLIDNFEYKEIFRDITGNIEEVLL